MRISVCMATYNGEKYLTQQLASIIGQLQAGDEFIISDDSSTDSTLSIIENLQDSRIKLIKNNTFYNPIYNFENALQQATGDVIVLSDQDDIWLENKLAVIRRHFEHKRSLIYTLVLDGFIIDDTGAIIKESIFDTIGSRKGILKNLYDNTYMGCSMAFSSELLSIALPFPKGIPMHDWWLGLIAECFGTVEFVREKTIKYRRHPANVSYRNSKVSQQIRRRYFLAYRLFQRWLTHSSMT
ncbi:MAG TPA: glycosyltransferase family 2 protein [Syntrophorhabdales bacterium]|nr:glycosyltransferase family 2 protein [Syntrophorhabdales bacterium]